MLVVTETFVRLHNSPNSDILAFADIIIDGGFKVSGIVIKSVKDEHSDRERLLLKFPFKPDRKGVNRDLAHPINREVHDYIFDEILKVYDAEVEKEKQRSAGGA